MSIERRANAGPESVVVHWVDAFNLRDLGRMLACVADAAVLHPLRLPGLKAVYRGREGMTEWVAEIERRRHEHRISISDVRCVGDTEVMLVGSLSLRDRGDVGSFSGLHRVVRGRILVMHHCLSDPDMIEQLGLIP